MMVMQVLVSCFLKVLAVSVRPRAALWGGSRITGQFRREAGRTIATLGATPGTGHPTVKQGKALGSDAVEALELVAQMGFVPETDLGHHSAI